MIYMMYVRYLVPVVVVVGGGVLLSKQIARFDADIPWEEQISDIDVQNV